MTLWYGLLPSFFLAPCLGNEDVKVKVDANRLIAGAVAAEATWRAFPGFVADLEIERNGVVSQGRLIVERDGRVFVELVPESHRDWAFEHLGWIVGQRLPKDDLLMKNWTFVNFPGERKRTGYAVCSIDAPFGPCHWIRNQRFQAVDIRLTKTKQRLTTLKTERNPENKHLPTAQVLHLWNARTKALEATETILLSWRRVGRFDLPATIQVLAVGTAAEPTTPAMGRMVLTRHRLFSSQETLFASRYDRRLR
jgi:hypothetical protein